jgi:hypothetical protein
MGQPYSGDLRERVVTAVEKEGLSRRQAAARFGVSYRAVIEWVKRFREAGSLEPGQMGGRKPKKISGGHRDWLVAPVIIYRWSGGRYAPYWSPDSAPVSASDNRSLACGPANRASSHAP